jgi:hypothetical protein
MAIQKNPHAVALGRLGGLAGGPKGGKARARALSPARRRAIARKAVLARWARAKAKTQAARDGPSRK